jgi:hypothetical protein
VVSSTTGTGASVSGSQSDTASRTPSGMTIQSFSISRTPAGSGRRQLPAPLNGSSDICLAFPPACPTVSYLFEKLR